MNTHTVSFGSFEHHQPVESAADTGGTLPREAPYAVELPPSLTDAWRGHGPASHDGAVITMAWVEDVGLVAVLLTQQRDVVAVVLDPSQQSVADAVDQWRQRGRMSVVARDGSSDIVADVAVHVDSAVDPAVMGARSGQTATCFRRATEAFSDVERVLSRLAATHRIKWATSHSVVAPATAL